MTYVLLHTQRIQWKRYYGAGLVTAPIIVILAAPIAWFTDPSLGLSTFYHIVYALVAALAFLCSDALAQKLLKKPTSLGATFRQELWLVDIPTLIGFGMVFVIFEILGSEPGIGAFVSGSIALQLVSINAATVAIYRHV